MKAKYCPLEHPVVTTNLKNSSNIWKRMLSFGALAEPRIRWLIGKGKIDAYMDQWRSTPISHLPEALQLNSFFNCDGTHNDHAFR